MKNKDEDCGSLQSFNLPVIGLRALTLATLLGVVLLGGFPGIASAGEVIRWNQIATDATTANKVDPLTESRIFAILHIAIPDAVNAVQPRYQSYLPRELSAPVDASVDAAVAGAAHEALVALLPAGKKSLDDALEESLGRVPEGPRKTVGVEMGEPPPPLSSQLERTMARTGRLNIHRATSRVSIAPHRRILPRRSCPIGVR